MTTGFINKFPNENENAIIWFQRWKVATKPSLCLCESSPDQGALTLFSTFRERLLQWQLNLNALNTALNTALQNSNTVFANQTTGETKQLFWWDSQNKLRLHQQHVAHARLACKEKLSIDPGDRQLEKEQETRRPPRLVGHLHPWPLRPQVGIL